MTLRTDTDEQDGDHSNSRDLAALAHHQAGHAVAEYYLGQQISDPNLADPTSRFRDAHPPAEDHPSPHSHDAHTRRMAEVRASVALGGPAAEAVLNGTEIRDYAVVYADVALADDLICDYVDSDWRWSTLQYLAAVERAESEAASPANWHAIEVLAKELLRRGSMSGREAEALIYSALYEYPRCMELMATYGCG